MCKMLWADYMFIYCLLVSSRVFYLEYNTGWVRGFKQHPARLATRQVDYVGVKRVVDAVKAEPGFKRFVFLSGGLAGKPTHPVALIGNLIGGGGPYYKVMHQIIHLVQLPPRTAVSDANFDR
jgi:hypothetical protein